MPSLTFARLAAMMNGEVVQGGDLVASSVKIDSREVKPDSVFFAIRGEKQDGHKYLPQALETAAGAVVSTIPNPLPPGKGIIKVDDTTVALQTLATSVRKALPFQLVAITGSAGKTTTKEMIATLLETERKTFRSFGNFNNQIGCPLSIANTPDDAQVVVSEMGMSSKGEIAFLAGMFRPDVGVYTNIRPVHLEFFDSIDGIAAAKRELLENVRDGGTIVINADDHRVVGISEGFPGRRVTYGLAEGTEYRATNVTDRGLRGTRFILDAEGAERTIELSQPGGHNLENFLAAIATARVLGISWEGIEHGTKNVKPAYHRGVVIDWRGATLYDDTYNSNPYAARRALELLSKADVEGRRIAVLGDMLELGKDERQFHYDVGHDMPENVDVVVGVGPRSTALVEGARAAGLDDGSLHHFADAASAAEFLKTFIREKDMVLVKASRGIGLDRIITALESEA